VSGEDGCTVVRAGEDGCAVVIAGEDGTKAAAHSLS